MILLWGLTGDGPFEAVHAAVIRRGAEFTLLDQRSVRETTVNLVDDGKVVRGTVEVAGDVIQLHDVHATYWRTYEVARVPAVAATAATEPQVLGDAWSIEDSLVTWMELTDARVVNRPSAMASNGSKPLQQELLRSHGFAVPKTLITTDPDAARRFWTDNGAVIYKSVSATRSIVARLTESHLERLEHVTSCPTQFQQLVPGRDHRVHVVGDDVFATEVFSDADDYRYGALAGQPAELRNARLPDEVAERCIEVTRALGLHFSGIDLRRAPDGRWFAFEVNPSPGFTYYEANTGQPIADAVANLLGG